MKPFYLIKIDTFVTNSYTIGLELHAQNLGIGFRKGNRKSLKTAAHICKSISEIPGNLRDVLVLDASKL